MNNFRELQENGLEAWDACYKEFVILFPWIIALLGDNPMQSELSSHIGMSGKCFCRVCKVESSSGSLADLEREEKRVRDFLNVRSPCSAVTNVLD
jgi:hypothetical protein